MYILNQINKNTTAYNLPLVFESEGIIDSVKCENAFKELIRSTYLL